MRSPLAVLRMCVQALRSGWVRSAWRETQVPPAAADADTLQAGLELATQGIIVLDDNWRIVVLNSQAQALMQSPGTTAPGTEFWEAAPEPVAEDHRSTSEQALQDGAAHAFVVHHAFEDRWIEYSLRRHDNGVIVNLRDVSDTRQALVLLQGSELCNQSLFEENTQPMWLLQPDSRQVLAFNKAAFVFYRFPGDSVPLPNAEVLFPEGEAASWLATLPLGDFRQELRVATQRRMNGELVLVELACSRVQWFERPVLLVSVVDVSERHFADRELQQLNESLEQRLAQCTEAWQRDRLELDTFTRAMSDDLKAPLHVVSGFAATLAERHASSLDEQGLHYLSRIRASTNQLAKLIDDLRTLAHLPEVAINPGPVDLAPACRRLIDELRKREPQRDLVLEIPDALPLFGDKALLTLAVGHLLDNAWKFTAAKPQAWIKVALVPGPADGSAVLVVSDNGVGFDAAYTDKLFSAFQRLHSSADFPGAGLGLAIVARVAGRHGGAVWATTTDGAGASFFLSLPQAPGGTVSAAAPATAADQAG